MSNEHLKTLTNLLTQMERGRYSTKEERESIRFAISAIERNNEMRELLEAAVTIGFQNDFLTRISPETWVRHSDDEASNGVQFDSAIDAWKAIQQQGE